MTADHIIPIVMQAIVPTKAKADLRMFATACKPCNSSKRERLPNLA